MMLIRCCILRSSKSPTGPEKWTFISRSEEDARAHAMLAISAANILFLLHNILFSHVLYCFIIFPPTMILLFLHFIICICILKDHWVPFDFYNYFTFLILLSKVSYGIFKVILTQWFFLHNYLNYINLDFHIYILLFVLSILIEKENEHSTLHGKQTYKEEGLLANGQPR